MSTLIFPDIHQNIDPVRRLLDKPPSGVKRYVFLGDWWDKFDSQPGEDALSTTRFLKSILHDTDKEFCWGNHDVQYYPKASKRLMCSGFSTAKFNIINAILTLRDWQRFDLWHWLNTRDKAQVLASHAGYSAEWLPKQQVSLHHWMLIHKHEAMRHFHEGKAHELFCAGWARGGNQEIGGVTWNDWRDHVHLPDIAQICGHTVGKAWRKQEWTDENDVPHADYCIDNELRSVALLHDDGQLEEIAL